MRNRSGGPYSAHRKIELQLSQPASFPPSARLLSISSRERLKRHLASCLRCVQQNNNCHSERVIRVLHHVVFIAYNMPIFGCVGTVQANCVNFSQFCLLQVPWARGTGVRRPFFRRRSQNSNAQNSHVHTRCLFLLFIVLTINDRISAACSVARGDETEC